VQDINVANIEYLMSQLDRKLFSLKEPVGDFSTRPPNILESCLAVAFRRISQNSNSKGLALKAATLFYLMIKNRPFQNNNRRIALTTLSVFLHLNNKWLKIDTEELGDFCVWVAQSPAKLKEETIAAAEKFIKSYLVDLK